ncbi:cell division protein FtsL [Paraliobacillus ryukyuensis]|uniref:cell division protein FtsL n=1 Tax=Paraliobacillus ryukyuensis TaxID=200904 RepID=UPI0009A7EEF7|nr:cell division protein FtsL [Paraliobacillus ryukyuensis]
MSASEARRWQTSVSEQPSRNQRSAPQKQVKVQEKQWVTPGEKFLYIMFGVAVIGTLIYVVHFSANLDALNRNVESVESKISEQQTKNENLSYQVKELSNPDRILRIAKENGLKIQNTQVKQTAKITE